MNSTPPPARSSAMLGLFFGGLLPVIAFSLIEENYGPFWGTAAGMFFGIAELIYEKIRFKKISAVTWVGNALILGLGGISILFQEGIWFKLQPAIFEAFFALILWGSWFTKRPFLLALARKQNPHLNERAEPMLTGMTFRLGCFFAVHAGLATWAAVSWTTAQWAWLKGAGVTISFLFYIGAEIIWARRQMKLKVAEPKSPKK